MTQEEKQLLIKDICARLPYGVKINVPHYYGDEDGTITLDAFWLHDIQHGRKEIKPYLRPMSSMTEKETFVFRQDILNYVEARCINAYGRGTYSLAFTEGNDWLNEHHFDYRGLIKNGLALEAPEDMYKNE